MNGNLSFKFNSNHNYKPLRYIGSLKLACLAQGLQYKTDTLAKEQYKCNIYEDGYLIDRMGQV